MECFWPFNENSYLIYWEIVGNLKLGIIGYILWKIKFIKYRTSRVRGDLDHSFEKIRKFMHRSIVRS